MADAFSIIGNLFLRNRVPKKGFCFHLECKKSGTFWNMPITELNERSTNLVEL